MNLLALTLLVFGISALANANILTPPLRARLEIGNGQNKSGESNKTTASEPAMSIKGTGGMTMKGTGGQLLTSTKVPIQANATTIHPQIVTTLTPITSAGAQSAKGVAPAATTKASINSATLTTPVILSTGTESSNATTTSQANTTEPEAQTSASTARTTFKGAAQQVGVTLSGGLVGVLAMLIL